VSSDIFIESIQDSGHVIVDTEMPAEGSAIESAIRSMDAMWRAELAFEAPELMMSAAIWAAVRMYRACQFFVFREIEAPVIERDLRVPLPQAHTPSVCYSVDLSLRLLPELLQLVRGLSNDDPLVLALTELARAWPLSSVGLANPGEIDLGGFIDHPCLRQLYVDRIIERNDLSRLNDPRVAAAVRSSLGAYPELAPAIAKAMAI
jgi:MoxR-vWA-beta-propeller ternary system domain bpX4